MNIEQFFARLRSAAAALTAKQLVTLTIAFVAVVSLTIGSAYWINTPTYGVLFSDMDNESAASVSSKLKTLNVAYALDDGGRTIRVPIARVDELRLQFASDGLPGSGHVGFEIFDRTAFGVTDFQEHINYRRALEGELARTISTISEVSGARVHIAMPQPSLFTGRDQPTKASVILKLRGNHQLAPSTVAAITGLVSASVESLRPESVVIIDNFGRPLSKAETAEEAAEGVPLERQQRIERDLTARVVSLLEPIVGAGRVRVNVSARLNPDTQEQTEERWDPTPVIRSQQTVAQTGPGAEPMAAAGSRANLPPNPNKPEEPPPAAPVDVKPGSHTAATTNYELSKTTRHSLQPRGEVTKLSVAVVLDDERAGAAQPAADAGGSPPADGAAPAAGQAKPRSAADIQKIQGLVAAAVGLDTDRGDQLTVENIAFEETPVEPLVAPGAWQQYGPQALEVGRIAGIVIIGVIAILVVIRPMVRGSVPAVPGGLAVPGPSRAAAAGLAQGGATGVARTVQDMEAEMDGQLESGGRLPVLTRRVAALTQREPENAARLLRTWLSEEQR